MIRSVYRFHVYYHVRRILKRLQTPLPHETGFNAADNPYTESEFFKICEDYRVPNDPMRYRDEKFYWTYQRGVGWPDDYIGPDPMMRRILETSVGFTDVGFTDVGLLRISESIRAYAFLILSSQASARSSIIGNSASSFTAQSAFLNNFENVVNRKVDIQEDVKRYQETLSYASSKVDYSVGEHLYMLPSDMELRIRLRTVRYNNKILVSDGKFNLGKNENVNSLEVRSAPQAETPAIKTNSLELTHAPTISHEDEKPNKTNDLILNLTPENVTQHSRIVTTTCKGTHSDEKIALVLTLAGGFAIWNMFG